jgi:hypothetical protein
MCIYFLIKDMAIGLDFNKIELWLRIIKGVIFSTITVEKLQFLLQTFVIAVHFFLRQSLLGSPGWFLLRIY